MEDDKNKAQLDKLLEARPGEEESNELIVRMALQLYKQSAEASRDERLLWKKWLDLRDGRHWEGVQWSDKRSQITANLTQSFIESQIAALTDNRPTIFCQPRDPRDQALAHDLEQAIYFVLDQNDWGILFPKVVRTSVSLGPGLVKGIWNPHIVRGGERGMIQLEPVMPFSFFPDNEATTLKAARFISHVQDLPYDWLLENYPEYADKIPTGEWDLLGHANKYGLDGGWDGVVPVMGTSGSAAWLMPYARQTGEKMRGLGQRARVMELLVRQTQNEMRRFLLCNGHVLENEPYGVPTLGGGFQPFAEYPWVMFPYRPLQEKFWPTGVVNGLEGLQLLLNKSESLILDQLLWNLYSAWVVDQEANLDYPISNAPNEVIKKSKAGEVRREHPSPISGEAFGFSTHIREMMEQFTGHVEILQGKNPTGVEAGKALALLQEQANSRIRQNARYLEHALEDLGELIIDFIAAYWIEPRWIRLLGPRGQIAYKQMAGSMFRGHEFDVSVKAGSTLPFSREQRMAEAAELYQLGAFGTPGSPGAVAEVLKARDWPEWEQIVARLEEEQAQAAQQQAQLAQQEQQRAAAAKARAAPPPPPRAE